jgi:spectinomycin phosphotransferase
VPDPAPVPDDEILTRVRARFGLIADAVEFLPLGYDGDAWVYRVHVLGGDRFLKIRRGPVNEAGLAVPQLLTARGIRHLIAPISTVTGEPFEEGDLTFTLFPFVEGESGGEAGMSAAQWAELGATMREIHDLPPDGELTSILRTEDFVPATIGMLSQVEERIHSQEHDDDPARSELAGFFRSHRDQIERLVARTEALAPLAGERARPTVICHADIHAWNVLVTPKGEIVIVDWESAMLAPRERDLMFVDGVAGGHAADPTSFFEGYGDVEPDPVVMAYYRIEWAVQDIAEFSAIVFLDPDAGQDTKVDALERIITMFAPGNEIDIVTRADPGDA